MTAGSPAIYAAAHGKPPALEETDPRSMPAPRVALALLLLIAVGQQYRYVSRAVLPAQDAVDFVSVAQRMEREGLQATLRGETVPPLFPAWVCATHRAGCRLGLLAENEWGRAAQLAAALPLVLAVVPLFLTARRLFGPTPAAIAGLLFCCLPEIARLGADGLSDSLHLLLVAWGLWGATAAMSISETGASPSQKIPSSVSRSPALLWWTTGSLVGAALLVRAEAVVIVAAVGLFGIASFVQGRRRRAGRSSLSPDPRPLSPLPCSACFAFSTGLLLALIPYVAAGVFEPGELLARLRGGGAPTETVPLNAAGALPFTETSPTPADADGPPLVFGHKDRTRSIRFHGFTAAAEEFIDEFAQAGGYCVLPLAALGAWTTRGRRRTSGERLLAIVVGLHLAIAFVVAWRGGYLSSRHLVLSVMTLLPAAAVGVVALGSMSRREGEAPAEPLAAPQRERAREQFLALPLAIACIVAGSRPVHEAQLAHRRASEWLASADARPGPVLDQQGFTALSSGRTTYRFDAAERALADPRLAYVLVERADLEAPSPRGRTLRQVLGDADRAAMQFADDRARPERDVLVFPRSPAPLLTAQRETDSHAR